MLVGARAMPGSRILRFTDPDEYKTAVGTDLRVVITNPGKFQSELRHVNLHDVALAQRSTSLPRIAHTAYRKNRCGITVVLRAAGARASESRDRATAAAMY
jgi:hypothetical protein